MPKMKVLAGDIKPRKYDVTFLFGEVSLMLDAGMMGYGAKTIDLKKQLDTVEVQSEESVRNLSKTVGWAGVGSLVAGPLGGLLGGYLGGGNKDVLFAAYLKDGRKFLATIDQKSFQKLQAITF